MGRKKKVDKKKEAVKDLKEEQEFLEHFKRCLELMKNVLNQDAFEKAVGLAFVGVHKGECPFSGLKIEKDSVREGLSLATILGGVNFTTGSKMQISYGDASSYFTNHKSDSNLIDKMTKIMCDSVKQSVWSALGHLHGSVHHLADTKLIFNVSGR